MLSTDLHSAPPINPDFWHFLVDLDRYPLFVPDSPSYRYLIADCRARLRDNGACEFPGFITPAGVQALVEEGNALASKAFFQEVEGNAYLSPTDLTLPENHPQRMTEPTRLGVIAYDQFPESSFLRRLYEWDLLKDFIGQCLGLSPLYRYADPLGALNLSVMEDGDYLRWHFDQTDFVVSLAIQSAESGGEFEFAPWIRNETEENYDHVREVLEGKTDRVSRLPTLPGTLILFKGRHSLHRVAPIHGKKYRLMGLLAYDEKPGTLSTPHLHRMRYGRSV